MRNLEKSSIKGIEAIKYIENIIGELLTLYYRFSPHIVRVFSWVLLHYLSIGSVEAFGHFLEATSVVSYYEPAITTFDNHPHSIISKTLSPSPSPAHMHDVLMMS